MPIYDYICSSCGHRTEVIHGINDPGPRFCPSCGAEGTLRKGFSTPAILFKGSGWAKKDRAATRTPTSSKPSETSSAGTAEPAAASSGSSGPGSSDSGASGSGDRSSGSRGGDRSERASSDAPRVPAKAKPSSSSSVRGE